jgi:lipid-binding SYLF domain-containing protein
MLRGIDHPIWVLHLTTTWGAEMSISSGNLSRDAMACRHAETHGLEERISVQEESCSRGAG